MMMMMMATTTTMTDGQLTKSKPPSSQTASQLASKLASVQGEGETVSARRCVGKKRLSDGRQIGWLVGWLAGCQVVAVEFVLLCTFEF